MRIPPPQLGGDLDANGSDITGVGHVGFLAAQDASAGANDLDDYEEGTFTPGIGDASLDGSGEGQTYSIQVGRYTKIGHRLFFQLRVAISDLGTLTTSEQCRVTGLPFTSKNVTNALSSCDVSIGSGLAITAGHKVSANISPNVAFINMQLWDATTGNTALLLSELTADGGLVISGHYEVE